MELSSICRVKNLDLASLLPLSKSFIFFDVLNMIFTPVANTLSGGKIFNDI